MKLNSLAKIPCSLLQLPHTLDLLHDCPLFIKPGITILSMNCFLESSFPYEDSHVTQNLTLDKCYAFFLLICLCPFNVQTQPGTLRGSRKTLSSATPGNLMLHLLQTRQRKSIQERLIILLLRDSLNWGQKECSLWGVTMLKKMPVSNEVNERDRDREGQ